MRIHVCSADAAQRAPGVGAAPRVAFSISFLGHEVRYLRAVGGVPVMERRRHAGVLSVSRLVEAFQNSNLSTSIVSG